MPMKKSPGLRLERLVGIAHGGLPGEQRAEDAPVQLPEAANARLEVRQGRDHVARRDRASHEGDPAQHAQAQQERRGAHERDQHVEGRSNP